MTKAGERHPGSVEFDKWAEGRHLGPIETAQYRNVWMQAWQAAEASTAEQSPEPRWIDKFYRRLLNVRDDEGDYTPEAITNILRTVLHESGSVGESPAPATPVDVMHVCLKCGGESWQPASSKLKRCACGGQIVGNPRRG